MFYINLLS